MPFTTAQKATVKADILANSDLNTQPNSADGNFEIARLYNLSASPAFWVWRTLVTKAEYTQTASVDGTTFNWTGTGFITRSQGERDAWNAIFNSQAACNPALPNVRQAFLDIFSGATAPAPANRTHLAAMSRRLATRLEKLLATGTGSTAAPATMGFEGTVSYQDIADARDS
jgi:hypothetical protein